MQQMVIARYANRQVAGQAGGRTGWWLDRQVAGQAGAGQAGGWTGWWLDRQVAGKTGGWTGRRIDSLVGG
jgi:hypothetical protein